MKSVNKQQIMGWSLLIWVQITRKCQGTNGRFFSTQNVETAPWQVSMACHDCPGEADHIWFWFHTWQKSGPCRLRLQFYFSIIPLLLQTTKYLQATTVLWLKRADCQLYWNIRSNFQHRMLPPSDCWRINPQLHFLRHVKKNGTLHGPDRILTSCFNWFNAINCHICSAQKSKQMLHL